MRFRFSGFGGSLSGPVALYFEAETCEAAREAGRRALQELAECAFAEITGPDNWGELLFAAGPAGPSASAT